MSITEVRPDAEGVGLVRRRRWRWSEARKRQDLAETFSNKGRSFLLDAQATSDRWLAWWAAPTPTAAYRS